MAVTAPISVSDITKVLGASSYDIGTLCTHDNINAASKYKPIVYPDVVGQLTSDQRKGTADDIKNGYYYGVRCLLQSSQLSKPLTFLHDCNYSYLRPTGGASAPYRLTDFLGYDHNAVFSPMCYISDDVAFVDISYGFTVTINYQQGNTTGIDVAELLKDQDNTSSYTALQMMQKQYPCILISSGTSSECWVRAMCYDTDGNIGTLATGTNTTSAWRNTWRVNFKDEDSALLSFIKDNKLRTTIFFISEIKPSSGLYDFSSWSHMTTADVSKIIAANMFTCPNGVDHLVEYKKMTSLGATLRFNVSGTKITMFFDFEPDASGIYTYSFSVFDKVSGASSISRSGTLSSLNSGFLSIDISEYLLNGYPDGTELSIHWSVRQNGNVVNEGSQTCIAGNLDGAMK